MAKPIGGRTERKAATGSTRKDTERRALMAKLQPHLDHLAANLTSESLDFTVGGVAKAIGVSRQTLYSHGVNTIIDEIGLRRQALVDRVQKARPGARQTIAMLRAQVEEWERRYNRLLDHHTRLVEALRVDGRVDVTAIVAAPLAKVDRSTPARGKRRGGYLRAL